MSSIVVSSWAIVSSPAAVSAASPTKQRRTFGVPGRSRVPAPQPTVATVIAGIRPADAASVVRIAAPVGVTSSAFTPVSTTGKPRRSSAVPGAGTGILPWGPSANPPPRGSAETWTAWTPVVPWARASASASRAKIRAAFARTAAASPLRSRIARMSPSVRWCWCARGSISTSTLVARNPAFRTSRATSFHPSSGSFSSSCLSASSGAPASTSAATTMSPAAPLGQSKYAILICQKTSAMPGARGRGAASGWGGRDPFPPRWVRRRTRPGGAQPPRPMRTPAAWSSLPRPEAAPRPCGPGVSRSSNLRDEVIDLARLVRGAVAVVDVDDRHPRRAGVEHRQKSRDAAEGRAIPHARRHRDHGPVNEASDDTRQRPLHAGDGDDRVGVGQEVVVPEQTVEPGDATVIDALDPVAERLGDERRLFGDRQVGGPGGRNHDQPGPLRALRPHDHEPRLGVVAMVQAGGGDRGGHIGAGAGGDDVRVVEGEPRENRDHLLRGLPRTEHRLGGAGPHGAVMVHLRESKILIGQAPEAPDRGVHVDPPRRELLEELPDFRPIHRPPSGRARAEGWRSPSGTRPDPRRRRRTRAPEGGSRSPRGGRSPTRAPSPRGRFPAARDGHGDGRGTGGSRASA